MQWFCLEGTIKRVSIADGRRTRLPNITSVPHYLRSQVKLSLFVDFMAFCFTKTRILLYLTKKLQLLEDFVPQDPLPGLCLWIPLGDFRPQSHAMSPNCIDRSIPVELFCIERCVECCPLSCWNVIFLHHVWMEVPSADTIRHQTLCFFMVALWNRETIYIFMLWLVLSSFFFFFSSPNLSRRRLDVCHTPTHGVALVRI